MNKHIIIFFCFHNIEHIKVSFKSMLHENIDYFIVENKSKYSDEIMNFFIDQKKQNNNIIGYIQFQNNIAANAINIFIKDYINLLKNYSYITFTDGDYYIYDIESTIQEILLAFNHSDCLISSVDLYQGNLITNKDKVSGIDYYTDFMKNRDEMTIDNVIGIGVPSLMTIRNEDLYILDNLYYNDSNIRFKLKKINKSWYITIKNLSYCQTCDIWYAGNEYHDWKMNIGHKIWYITEISDYIKII